MAPDCAECVRLRNRHEQAILEHEQLLADLRNALQERRSEVVTLLIISEAAALRQRDQAETALRTHNSAGHGKSGTATASSA
jgi:hypothetical protein